jgi:single-strand DNA-binding protein
VRIIANTVQFLGSRDGAGGGNNGGGGGFSPPQSDVPADMSDFGGAPANTGAASEDDIPF